MEPCSSAKPKKRKSSGIARHARGTKARRGESHPAPVDRVAVAVEEEEEDGEEEVAEDDNLTSPPAPQHGQHGRAAATPPTDEMNSIERLLAAAKHADEDPELLDNMRALKNTAMAQKRQAEQSRDFWHGEADTARSKAQGLAEELAAAKEALSKRGQMRPRPAKSRVQRRKLSGRRRDECALHERRRAWAIGTQSCSQRRSRPLHRCSGVGSMSAATTTLREAGRSCAGRRVWSPWCRMDPTSRNHLPHARRSMR